MQDTVFPQNVKVMPYIDNLAGLFKECDLIISRAGASTISEILALRKPSILIPSPYVSGNHQYYNALDLVNLKVAELIEEKSLNVEVIEVAINEILNNEFKYREMVNNLNKLNKESSTDIIYKEIRNLIK